MFILSLINVRLIILDIYVLICNMINNTLARFVIFLYSNERSIITLPCIREFVLCFVFLC